MEIFHKCQALHFAWSCALWVHTAHILKIKTLPHDRVKGSQMRVVAIRGIHSACTMYIPTYCTYRDMGFNLGWVKCTVLQAYKPNKAR